MLARGAASTGLRAALQRRLAHIDARIAGLNLLREQWSAPGFPQSQKKGCEPHPSLAYLERPSPPPPDPEPDEREPELAEPPEPPFPPPLSEPELLRLPPRPSDSPFDWLPPEPLCSLPP